MDDPPTDDGVALVTGASSGIGRAVASIFAEDGFDVALAARSASTLAEIAADLEHDYGVSTLDAPTDVRDPQAIDALVDRTIDCFGRLNAVVSNAGVFRERGTDIEDVSTEAFTDLVETNIGGAFYLTRASIPHLRAVSGNLVFIGSAGGVIPRSAAPIYAATKWWINGFAHSIEADEGGDGVGVSVVNPGRVRTEMEVADDTRFTDLYDEGEILEPREVAEAVRFVVGQPNHSTVSRLDLWRREKLSDLY